jgi:integrase
MPKIKRRTVKTGKLTALKVSKVKKSGLYGDGGGLYLRVQHDGSKSWVFRFNLGKAREMGLGPLHTFSLAEARERAKGARQLVYDGKDPIETARDAKAAAKVELAKAVTFKDCAERYIAGHKAGWKNKKHIWQWSNSLERYAYPEIGELPVARITKTHVLKVVEPLWATMPETGSRVRGRIEKILDWAKSRELRDGDNPADLKVLSLPKLSTVRRIEHHPALPYSEIGSFMAKLREQKGVAADALEFAILTAARTGEVIGATWDELDLDKALWIVPAVRMKGRKGQEREHRVPLSPQAVAVLKRRARHGAKGFVFPGAKSGSHLSNMAMLELLRRMDRDDISVHGFRSTFRVWCGECTAFPREVAEAALAHRLKDKAEAAYARGDLFAKRAQLMSAWADRCDRVEVGGDNVVQMQLALA